jgi:hypothetical protein
MVRLVGLEPTTGKSPADFKPAAYANFATAAPGVTRQQQDSTPGQCFRTVPTHAYEEQFDLSKPTGSW